MDNLDIDDKLVLCEWYEKKFINQLLCNMFNINTHYSQSAYLSKRALTACSASM